MMGGLVLPWIAADAVRAQSPATHPLALSIGGGWVPQRPLRGLPQQAYPLGTASSFCGPDMPWPLIGQFSRVETITTLEYFSAYVRQGGFTSPSRPDSVE